MGVDAAAISRDEFEETLRRVERLLQRVNEEANSLVRHCNRVLNLLPGVLTNGLQETLASFLDTLTSLFTLFAELIGSPGWPPALYEVGNRWTDEVGARASALAGLASTDQSTVDEKWEGPAAQAYAQALAAQAKALNAIKTATDEIDDALLKLSGALIFAWMCLAGALVTYVAELCAAAGAAATGVGAPAGAAGAGLSTVKIVGIVITAISGIATLGLAIFTQYKDLNQRLTNSDGLPGGSWPAIHGVNPSDAQVTDGDNTDWRLRY